MHELYSTLDYLGHMYVILEAKFGDARINIGGMPQGKGNRSEVPPGVDCEIVSPSEILRRLKATGDRITHGTLIRRFESGAYPHKRINAKSYQVPVGLFPKLTK